MGNPYKAGRQQRRQGQGGQQKERTGPSHQELSKLYGELVFTPLEVMVKELSGKGVVLESGDFGHIKDLAGEEFTGRVQSLRHDIEEGVPQEHKGAVDGWMKQTINDSFEVEADAENAFFLILPGQAKKHQLIQALAGFVSQHGQPIKIVAETKTAVKSLLDQATNLVQKLGAETDAISPEPKRANFPDKTFGQFLQIKGSWRAAQTEAKSGLGEIRGQISWLRNWVEGKPWPGKSGADAPPDKPKGPIEVKRQEIAALKAKIAEVQKDENKMAGLKNYAKAGEYAAEWAKLQNTELPRLEAELITLEQAEAMKARVEAAAQVMAASPGSAVGTFPAPEVGAAAAQAIAAGKPAMDFAAETARLETEITNQLAAVKKHEAMVVELQAQVATVAAGSPLEGIKLLQRIQSEAAAAVAAQEMAAKRQVELDELKAKAATTAEAPKLKPAAPPTPADNDKPATDTTTGDPVMILEAVLEDVEDADLTKAVAGLLNAVRLAKGANKGAKRIARALARFQAEEVDVEALVADTEALLELAK